MHIMTLMEYVWSPIHFSQVLTAVLSLYLQNFVVICFLWLNNHRNAFHKMFMISLQISVEAGYLVSQINLVNVIACLPVDYYLI